MKDKRTYRTPQHEHHRGDVDDEEDNAENAHAGYTYLFFDGAK